MLRFTMASIAVAVVGAILAAPVPPERPAKALVDALGDPSAKVRDESFAALRDRADARPWLRRAARSADQDIARRAAALLVPHEKARQEAVVPAIDACVREGRIDLLTEWHQFWKPRAEADLWTVGPRAAKAGMDLFAKSCPKGSWERFEKMLALHSRVVARSHDGPYPEQFRSKGDSTWSIRTDRMVQVPFPPECIRFASIGGPAHLGMRPSRAEQFLVLGPVQARRIDTAFVACDGDVWGETPEFEPSKGVLTARGIVVCRGNFTGWHGVGACVLLVDGDVDLTQSSETRGNLIRASGEVRLPSDKDALPVNCTIESRVKDATAPYKFFEVSDTGLLVADDEEGLVVTGIKPNTPFGTSGIAKGDLIRSIDDAPAGHSEQFRKVLRRALVCQGDCLITVTRGDKTIDIPVFFPLPK
ncbi:PDZ domain-containing protein [Gemmata sp. G18]|uniref:PDZ domain-containing protein n=1 Tax=Gemmata palustris TaxID=2822762 RepID=A0ABS5BR40_9BACT|nr:PDZ domain-containing protein [Gemmata palustris]MBP3956176.1 PDZ domain-containing protein [Gemmata palustris]